MTTRVYAGGGGGGGGSERVGGSCDKRFPHFRSQHQIVVNRGVVVGESLDRNCRRRSSFLGGQCSLLPTKIPAASAGVSGILRGLLQRSLPASSAASSGRRRDQHRHHGGPPGHLQARAKVLFPPHSPAGIHPDHHTSTTSPRVFFLKKKNHGASAPASQYF